MKYQLLIHFSQRKLLAAFFVFGNFVCFNGDSSAQQARPKAIPQINLLPPAHGPKVTKNRVIDGTVVTPDGTPVPNAIILRDFGTFAGLADQDGKFNVTITHLGTMWAMPLFVLHPSKPLSCVFALPVDVEHPTIQLKPEGNIVGRLVDENGKPLAGIPVGLQASFLGETNGHRNFVSVRTRLFNTHSREDGTFRFQGIPDGLHYRAMVGPQFISGQSPQAREKNTVFYDTVGPFGYQFGDRTSRKPLVVPQRVLTEIEKVERAIGEHPKMLQPIRGQIIGRSPAVEEALRLENRAVMLGFVANQKSFEYLNVIHDLFSQQGLKVVCVMNGTLDASKPAIKALAESRVKPAFTVVIEDGSITSAYGIKKYPTYLLYDSNGALRPTSAKGISAIRNHMIYVNGKDQPR